MKTMVSWGPTMAEQAGVTSPQLEALKAVREAGKKTASACYVSGKTATWFSHKTTINSIAAKALEKLGLIRIESVWRGSYYTHLAWLTDRGAVALSRIDRRETPRSGVAR